MKSNLSKMIETESKINYNYATIKITQSRIDKGLVAIPRSLAKWFPDSNATIQVYFDDSPTPQYKNYSSYTSTTRENRIGGMAQWFEEKAIKKGDEIVIQIIDKKNYIYRLISEKDFIITIKRIQKEFDNSENEEVAAKKIIRLADWTNLDKKSVVLREYHRLVKTSSIQERQYAKKKLNQAKEGVPYNLRVLLAEIYQGHCQLCDFTFLKRDKTPYFEIHHIDPSMGSYPKNLILVCANCHRQFEYADVRREFNSDRWLTKVFFNNIAHPVNQIIFKSKFETIKKIYL